MRIGSKHRRWMAVVLTELTQFVRKEIPLGEIAAALEQVGLLMVDEDGSPWEGLLCGQQGRATIALASMDGQPVENSLMCLSWYKFESGKYEVVAYLS